MNIIPAGLQEALIFIPETNEVLAIQIGSGDQLLKEDIDEGYIDYLDVSGFKYVGSAETDVGFEAADGDMWMTKESIKDINSVLDDFLRHRYSKSVDIIFMKGEI